jgi:hypothetical protein
MDLMHQNKVVKGVISLNVTKNETELSLSESFNEGAVSHYCFFNEGKKLNNFQRSAKTKKTEE